MKIRTVPVALLAALQLCAQVPDPSTLEGKVLLGYQGWFRCPGGGPMGTNWSHWSNGAPTAASLVIDMYPDLRELEPGEGCVVPGMTIAGAPARLFSSGSSATVDRHFRWMKQYGLDGVLVQRFITDIPGSRAAGDVVLRNVMAAARRHGRVFAIEYDISGANAATLFATLQSDWKYLVETLGVTAEPGYLRHSGRPVLGVWGIGLNDTKHPPNDPAEALRIIEWFRNEARIAYIGGTPAYWRTLSNDAATDPRWSGVYEAMDGIQPWTVGRYSTPAAVDRWKTERLQPDLATTDRRGQLYLPVVFPGFSWFNLNRTAPQNQIPRNRGEFLWRQAYNAKAAGARMLKIAMFDEVNESTAMFKLASRRADAPDQGFWLTLDADGFTLPSDWYLRLAGEITRVFHGQAPPSATLPEAPGPPFAGDAASNLVALNGAAFGGGALAAGAIATVYGEALREGPGAGWSLTVIDASGLGRTATLLHAAAGQWNIVTPEGLAVGPATLVAEAADGTVTHGRVDIRVVAPGLFTAAANGRGAAAGFVRVTHPGGAQETAPISECPSGGTCQALAISLGPEGSVTDLELYGTGIRGRSTLEAVTCTVGGTPAPVLFAGPQGSFPGLDQVNVRLPRSLSASGLVNLELQADGVAANVVQLLIR